MGFFRYSNKFSMIKFDFCRTLGILKGQIEDSKYFLEWGSNPQKKYILGQEYKNISFVFGSSENCRICFRN